MKSIKVLALIVGTIALLPSGSFAQNVNGNTQETNLNSVTIGSGNLSITETQQRIIDLQKSGEGGTNIGATNQVISGSTTTLGNQNINVQKVVQESLSGQNSQ